MQTESNTKPKSNSKLNPILYDVKRRNPMTNIPPDVVNHLKDFGKFIITKDKFVFSTLFQHRNKEKSSPKFDAVQMSIEQIAYITADTFCIRNDEVSVSESLLFLQKFGWIKKIGNSRPNVYLITKPSKISPTSQELHKYWESREPNIRNRRLAIDVNNTYSKFTPEDLNDPHAPKLRERIEGLVDTNPHNELQKLGGLDWVKINSGNKAVQETVEKLDKEMPIKFLERTPVEETPKTVIEQMKEDPEIQKAIDVLKEATGIKETEEIAVLNALNELSTKTEPTIVIFSLGQVMEKTKLSKGKVSRILDSLDKEGSITTLSSDKNSKTVIKLNPGSFVILDSQEEHYAVEEHPEVNEINRPDLFPAITTEEKIAGHRLPDEEVVAPPIDTPLRRNSQAQIDSGNSMMANPKVYSSGNINTLFTDKQEKPSFRERVAAKLSDWFH